MHRYAHEPCHEAVSSQRKRRPLGIDFAHDVCLGENGGRSHPEGGVAISLAVGGRHSWSGQVGFGVGHGADCRFQIDSEGCVTTPGMFTAETAGKKGSGTDVVGKGGAEFAGNVALFIFCN